MSTFPDRMIGLADRLINKRDWKNTAVWRQFDVGGEHLYEPMNTSALAPLDGEPVTEEDTEFERAEFTITAPKTLTPKRQDTVQFGVDVWTQGVSVYRVTALRPTISGDKVIAYRVRVQR